MLEIQALRKTYPDPNGGVSTIVDIPAFFLSEGEQLALRGESGSGKTTFLNLIAGILLPDTGCIRIGGTDMAALPEPARDRLRAERIGYIFQTFNLLQGFTALENVLLGAAFSGHGDRHHARLMLERMGLSARLDYFPRQLSTGQQQRVAVARALAHRPKIVLADEPTGNLDRSRAVEALRLIRETCRENGAALLLVSHDEHALSQFEHVKNFAELNRASRHSTTAC